MRGVIFDGKQPHIVDDLEAAPRAPARSSSATGRPDSGTVTCH